MSKQSKKQNFIFTLYSVNIIQINEKYGLANTNLPDKTGSPRNTTKICELNNERNTPEIVSFLDESKKLHACKVSMIDHMSRLNISSFIDYKCFWCKNPFEFSGIGCPIRYIAKKAVKSYYSEISKDMYTIKENITSNKKNPNDDLIVIDSDGGYYETDGIFCSWNCMQAFIIDNKHNRIYDQSQSLMIKMYSDITGDKNIIITPAGSWRLLEEYGGHLTIQKFRENFNKIEYDYYGKIKIVPTGMLYEEKIKF